MSFFFGRWTVCILPIIQHVANATLLLFLLDTLHKTSANFFQQSKQRASSQHPKKEFAVRNDIGRSSALNCFWLYQSITAISLLSIHSFDRYTCEMSPSPYTAFEVYVVSDTHTQGCICVWWFWGSGRLAYQHFYLPRRKKTLNFMPPILWHSRDTVNDSMDTTTRSVCGCWDPEKSRKMDTWSTLETSKRSHDVFANNWMNISYAPHCPMSWQ
jgi:hypothetical protein